MAASWQEFNQEFLKAGQSKISEQLCTFRELCSRWGNCPEVDAYEALKRIYVETVSENFLRTSVESRLAALVEGDPATVADVLAQLALEKVHYELTAQDIWHHLVEKRQGFRRRQWSQDPHVLAAIEDANRRYLSPLYAAAIARQIIPKEKTYTKLTPA